MIPRSPNAVRHNDLLSACPPSIKQWSSNKSTRLKVGAPKEIREESDIPAPWSKCSVCVCVCVTAGTFCEADRRPPRLSHVRKSPSLRVQRTTTNSECAGSRGLTSAHARTPEVIAANAPYRRGAWLRGGKPLRVPAPRMPMRTLQITAAANRNASPSCRI